MNKKIKKIINMKRKKKIVCLTAYSKNFAEIIDKHADIILVGDSLGSVLYNYETTRKVTLENMIKHSCSVKKGVKKIAANVENVVIHTESARFALAKKAITLEAVPPGQHETRINPTAKKVGKSNNFARNHPIKGIIVNCKICIH